jgi:UDP-glucose 4-epimerase
MPALTIAPELASFYANRRVCVTGGAGFIGSHLCDALVQCGAQVTVIDDLSNGRRDNLAAIAQRIRLVEGSILDAAALQRAVEGAELVFHEAAMCSVPGSVEHPLESHQVNATGTVQVLDSARHLGVNRVVYAASGGSAYGNSPQLPKVETMLPEPMSPYAVGKLAGEFMLRAFAECYGLSCISLRYFNIFGARQRSDSPYAAVIPLFATAMREGRPVTIYGDGTQTRDFTHVSNVVHANLLAGASEKPLRGEVVNIACGRSYNLLELVEKMGKILEVKPQSRFAPPRVGEVQHSMASIQAARAMLGYEPITDFEQGLRLTLAAYQGP